MRAVNKIPYKKRKGQRVEFVIDDYTNKCIEKIQGWGFNSRKAAIIYALQRVASEGEEKK